MVLPALRRSLGINVFGTVKQCQAATPVTVQAVRHASRDMTADGQERRSMGNLLTRDWRVGDVYAPHDISAAEMRKWRKKHRPSTDAFDVLSLDPLSLYKNFSVMSEYMTDMGRIRPSSETGLRPVNQRKIAKAIRRAIALGLMPSVHKHPEILKKKKENTMQHR